MPWSAIGPLSRYGQAVWANGRRLTISVSEPDQVSVVRGRVLRRAVPAVQVTVPAVLDAAFVADAIGEYATNPANRDAIGTRAELERLQAQFRAGTPATAPAK